jgi:hypothetical protein
LDIAKEYCNKKLTAVDHDNKVKADLSSIFDTPRYKSHEAKSIIVHAAKYPLTEVMLTIYTTYHSPLSGLLFSYLEHSDVKTMIEIFHWMQPLMNYSFPLRLREISLFPTMSSRRRFRILVQAIHKTPAHRPDASRFFNLIWLSACEYCACEITSGYCTMSLCSFLDYAPSVSNNTLSRSVQMMVLVYSGANISMGPITGSIYQQTIQCWFQDYIVKKKITEYRNNNHGGPLRFQC